MRPDDLERRLRARLGALGPAPRAELLHVLMLPDFERAGSELVVLPPKTYRQVARDEGGEQVVSGEYRKFAPDELPRHDVEPSGPGSADHSEAVVMEPTPGSASTSPETDPPCLRSS